MSVKRSVTVPDGRSAVERMVDRLFDRHRRPRQLEVRDFRPVDLQVEPAVPAGIGLLVLDGGPQLRRAFSFTTLAGCPGEHRQSVESPVAMLDLFCERHDLSRVTL